MHKLLALPTPPESFFRKYRTMIKKFLWNGGRARISFDKLVQDHKNLGLKLVDLEIKNIALKAAWPLRWMHTDPKQVCWFFEQLPIKNKMLWECNTDPLDIKKLIPPNTLTTSFSIWEAWAKFNFKVTLETVDEILGSRIYGNSLIRCMNKPIFDTKIFKVGFSMLLEIFDFEKHKF